jgi:hypothetical protein
LAASRGGEYTPKRGPFQGQTFRSYYAYRDEMARRAGYESGYQERQDYRKETREILGHELKQARMFRGGDLRGERNLLRAWREGKLMGQAKRSGNRTGQAQHRRNMDFALLDLFVERPDFSVEQDFWTS